MALHNGMEYIVLGFIYIPFNSLYFWKWINANPMKIFSRAATQRAKFAEKVLKPPLWVNVINFELNGLDASIFNMCPLE